MRMPFRAMLLSTASVVALGLSSGSPALSADIYVAPEVVDVPPPVGRTVSGTVDVFGSYSWLAGLRPSNEDPFASSSEYSSDYPLLGGKGRVDIPFNETTSLQLDLGGEAAFHGDFDTSSSSPESYNGNITAGAHLNYRELDRYLLGAFGGGGGAFLDSKETDSPSQRETAPFFFVGAEGQYYLGKTTFYGQLGYLDSNQASHETLEDAWFVRGVARHFFNQGATKLEGELSYTDGKQDTDGSVDSVSIFGWGAELEHQLTSWGGDGFLTGYVRYEGRFYDETNRPEEYTEHTLFVGLKVDFHQSSLLSRDRSGATLDLPNFGRWVGGTAFVDD